MSTQRRSIHQGEPLKPSEVRNTVRGFYSSGGGWNYPENQGYSYDTYERPSSDWGGQRHGGYYGQERDYEYDYPERYYSSTRRPSSGWRGAGVRERERYISPGRGIREVTHVHRPEVVRDVVQEDHPIIREVIHVQHRPMTVKDVYVKTPEALPQPREIRRAHRPEVIREVVHEVKPVIREVVHKERRPVIVREKYAVEKQPEVRHLQENVPFQRTPEVVRDVVHEERPIYKEIYHHNHRPMSVRDRYEGYADESYLDESNEPYQKTSGELQRGQEALYEKEP